MAWTRSHWKAVVATVVAFVVGAVAGASGASQQDELASKDSRIASLKGDLRSAHIEIDQQGDTIKELASYRDDALRYRRHKQEIAQEAAAAREAARRQRAEQRARDRQAREAAQQAAQGTIKGDGTWHVGEDFSAGTYRADAGEGCYWARMTTPHGGDSIDDIIENGIGNGSQTVQLNDGEWFETSDCGPWEKIG